MSQTSPNEPAPSSEHVAARLSTAVGALVRATRAADRLARIPAAVLSLLDTRGPLTTADLAAGRGVRHQTMAATIKELTEAGYVSATPDQRDGRKKLLALTRSGKDALDDDRRQRIKSLTQALDAALDADERRALDDALALFDRLTDALTGSRQPPPPGQGPVTSAW